MVSESKVIKHIHRVTVIYNRNRVYKCNHSSVVLWVSGADPVLRNDMGLFQSKEEPESTGPPALLSEPWRSPITWSHANKNQLLEDINSFKVKGRIKHINCFLLGQAASGKTSFLNTSCTALKDEGRLLAPLTVLKSSGSSVTTKLQTQPLITKQNKASKLRIFDCRGLHENNGVTSEDIRLIVDGHIKEGYTINPVRPISHSDPHYRKKPKLKNIIHCVVYVVNAENPRGALAGEAASEIFRDIQIKLTQRDVPQVVLMTKVDRLRPSLADDISNLFHSMEVKRKFHDVVSFTNLPEMNVLPMSNYHNESEPNIKKDILALTNLKTIMNFANDFIAMECAQEKKCLCTF